MQNTTVTLIGFSYKPLENNNLPDGINYIQLYKPGENQPCYLYQGEVKDGELSGFGLAVFLTNQKPWFCAQRGTFSHGVFQNQLNATAIVQNFIKSDWLRNFCTIKTAEATKSIYDEIASYNAYQATFVGDPFNEDIINGHSISIIVKFSRTNEKWMTFKLFKANETSPVQYVLLDTDINYYFSSTLRRSSSTTVRKGFLGLRAVQDESSADEVGPTLLINQFAKPTTTQNPKTDEFEYMDKFFRYNSSGGLFGLSYKCSGVDQMQIKCADMPYYEKGFNPSTGMYEEKKYYKEVYAHNLCSDAHFYHRPNRGSPWQSLGDLKVVEKADCGGIQLNEKTINSKTSYVYGRINNKYYNFTTDFTKASLVDSVYLDTRRYHPLPKVDTTTLYELQNISHNQTAKNILTKVASAKSSNAKSTGIEGAWFDVNNAIIFQIKPINQTRFEAKIFQLTPISLSDNALPSQHFKTFSIFKEQDQLKGFPTTTYLYDQSCEQDYKNLKIKSLTESTIHFTNGLQWKRLDNKLNPQNLQTYFSY